MKEKILEIRKRFEEDIEKIKSMKDLNDLKVNYFGKKGKVSELSSLMKDISNEDKKEFGMRLNELRTALSEKIDYLKERYEMEELNRKLESETIDISLPATKIPMGAPNILERVIEEVEELFMSMGYDVYDGPEIEEDKYNFELLNIPKGHPARDAQDTFYI